MRALQGVGGGHGDVLHGEHAGGGHGELGVGERRQAGDHCLDNGTGNSDSELVEGRSFCGLQ